MDVGMPGLESGGQCGLTGVVHALGQRVLNGGEGRGEQRDEPEHPVMTGGTPTTADGQRGGVLSVIGLT